MIDFDVAYDKLAQFERAGDIAEFLTSYGVKAEKRSAVSCAISAWMQEQTGLSIRTNYHEVMVVAFDDEFNIREARYHTTALNLFIHNFDLGRYPALEA